MRKTLLIILTLLLVLPAVHASSHSGDSLNVTIDELGKITNYLNTYWVVNVNGSGVVSNPSDRDLFDVVLRFDLLTLQVVDLGGDGEFTSSTTLTFDRIPAGGTQTFSYNIVGITVEPPTLTDRGVMYTALTKKSTRIYSDVFGELQKASPEDAVYTGRNGILVSTTLRNPTTFEFTIESMQVIKTPTLNPNQVLDSWQLVNSSSPRILDPNGFFVEDILDTNFTEGQVYWLDTDVFISRVNLIDRSNLTRLTEVNLTIPIEELNFTNETDPNATRRVIDRTYRLQKQISDTVAVPGQPVTVVLIVNNLGPSLEKYTLVDVLPAGFTANNDLRWSGEVPARNSVVLEYQAVLNDTDTAGFDIFPRASAIIRGSTIYSQEVPFVRQFIPDERVYVQKRVRFREDDTVLVTVTVENLGRSRLEGATLKEFLGENDLFSEISEVPQSKGVWAVPTLAPTEMWEITYVTEDSPALSRLPALYGVKEKSVLRSIILESIVNEAWEFVRTNAFELVGVLVIVLVPSLLMIGRRLSWFTR